MTEITCENFYTELPTIEAAIKQSVFIGIDMEFSKIHENIYKPFTYLDSSEERYYKLRQKVSDITCIQLGLSIFTYDSSNKTFKTCSYSFYTYPQTFYKCDSVVSFQTSSVEFLCKHKFDFNKLFYNRIPYLTDEQEVTIKSQMLDTLFFDKYFESNLLFFTIENELVKDLNIVSEWYDNANYGESLFLEINGCNEPAYIILIQYNLLKKFKYICIDENQKGLNIIKIMKNEDSELSKNQIYENLKLSLLDKMIGIKYLLKLISKLKKPIVGHNCSLDILILCNQFFKPLPDNFKDFQSFMSNNFGSIYDTKLICKEVKYVMPKNAKWLGSSLSEIYSYIKYGDGKLYSDCMCIALDGMEESQNMKFHHAGWDAYYTGFCFIKMTHIIKQFSYDNNTINQRYTLTELFKSVELFKNKLFTYRSVSNSIDLLADNHQDNIHYLVIQNKGIIYKALDLNKLKNDIEQISNFDLKLLSKYAALVVIPFKNTCVIKNLKLKYKVEQYSHYQRRKRKLWLISCSLIMITSITVVAYLRK